MSIWNNIILFGTSRGKAVGATLQNVPAGIKIDEDLITQMLYRRKAKGVADTARQENDVPNVLSGIYKGYTTGEPITVVFENQDAEVKEDNRNSIPRPSHADYTANIASKGLCDLRGGGAYSGRLTLGLVYAGAIAKQYLALRDIEVLAKLQKIAYVADMPMDTVNPDLDALIACQLLDIPMLNDAAREKSKQLIADARLQGDSLSAGIECMIYNLPAGLGGMHFSSLESVLSQGLFAIPAVKAVQFGDLPSTLSFGSNYNDILYLQNENIKTITNHCGGVLGGRSNGMPVYFQVEMKPTPSIGIPQQTINLKTKCETRIQNTGRNDVCIGIRACPVVESVAALWAMYALQEQTE